jgi:hypothetical protein
MSRLMVWMGNRFAGFLLEVDTERYLCPIGSLVAEVWMFGYRELLAYARDLWDRYASPATLDWMTDTLGSLVAHPAADGDARRSLCEAVFAGCACFQRHVSPEARDLLRLIANDIGAEKEFEGYLPQAEETAADEEDLFGALAGKAVAVYTLTERAGRQFKQVLEGRVAGVSVSLCHDQDGSKRLKQLARQADLFVVVTASAKHAATDCIDASRGKELPIVRPSGKWERRGEHAAGGP